MSRSSQPAQPWQVIRYLLVGGFNTCFGYALFVTLNYLFRSLGVYGSEIASLLSNIIAITVAFLGYKWFVFRTHGHYLREWLRCLSVYGSSMLFSLVMLPPLTLLLRRWFGHSQMASNVAAAILTVVVVAASYFGHKHFSFRRTGDAMDAVLDPNASNAVESRP
jgi:putative flippase GtrA